MNINEKSFRTWFWIIPMSLAGLLAGYIYFVLPHERHVETLGLFLFKLLPFFLAGLGIATFPRRTPSILKLVLLFCTIVLFFAFFIPRQLYFMQLGMFTGLDMPPGSDSAPLDEIFAQYYTITAIIVPFFILSVAFGFRLGGGTTGNTLKFVLAGIVFMVSGIEDIAFFVVNGLGEMPEIIHWASHMTVRLGRPATRTEFFIICALHFVLIGIILALPLDKMIQRLQQRLFVSRMQMAEA